MVAYWIEAAYDNHLASSKGDTNLLTIHIFQLQRRYIAYHVTQLIVLGMDCVPEYPVKSDFLLKANALFLRDLVNLKKAFYFLEYEGPCTLFSKNSEGKELRTTADITHLFLCLCRYHEWFDSCLIDSLEKLVHQDIPDLKHRVLTHTLYITILTFKEKWSELKEYRSSPASLSNLRAISTTPDLYRFCQSLQSFSVGSLYAYESTTKVDKSELHQRMDVEFDNSFKKLNLSHLSSDWRLVRRYFHIEILLAMAKAIVNIDARDMVFVKEASNICLRAKSMLTENVGCLQLK